MKKGWEHGILEDAVNKASSNISLNKIKNDDGSYPVFGAKGFAKNVSFYHQEKEYLGIIKDGAGIGRVKKYPAKSSVVATMQYILPKEGYNIDFVRYFLESLDFENYRTGSTIPHIYFKNYKNAKFPLVSTNEQKQIVALLDTAFAKIDQAKADIEKNIVNAKELFQSKLNEIFSQKGDGWEEKSLGEVCDGFQYGSSSKSIQEGKVPVLRMGNIQDFKVDWKKLKYSSNDDEINKYLLKEGDVLFNRTNSPVLVGKSAIYKGEMPAIFAGYLIRVRGKSGILNNEFLNFYLNTNKTREYGFSIMSSSVNQANINASKLKGYLITIPKIEVQKNITKVLRAAKIECDKIISNYSTKLQNLEELKKSLLQKAFAGELTQKQKAVAV